MRFFEKPCKYELPYPVPFAVAPSARSESWISYTYRGSSTTKSVLGMAIAFSAAGSIGSILLLVMSGIGSVAVTQNGYLVPNLFLCFGSIAGTLYFMWLWRLYNIRFEITVSLVDGSCRFIQERSSPISVHDAAIQISPSKIWNEDNQITLVVIASDSNRRLVGAFKEPTFAVEFAEELAKETGLTVMSESDPDLLEVQGAMRIGGKDAHAIKNRLQDAPIFV